MLVIITCRNDQIIQKWNNNPINMLFQMYVKLAFIHFICFLYYAPSIPTLHSFWSCGRNILTQIQLYVNETNTPREMRLTGWLQEISILRKGMEACVPLCQVKQEIEGRTPNAMKCQALRPLEICLFGALLLTYKRWHSASLHRFVRLALRRQLVFF